MPIPTHPVQTDYTRGQAVVPQVVSLAAYEVYCHINSPQPALITGNCRGGFGISELVSLLYARSFPKDEWMKRYIEALNGMQNL